MPGDDMGMFGVVIGMLVDHVSDILTVPYSQIQPIPQAAASLTNAYSEGIRIQRTG